MSLFDFFHGSFDLLNEQFWADLSHEIGVFWSTSKSRTFLSQNLATHVILVKNVNRAVFRFPVVFKRTLSSSANDGAT